MYIHVTKPERLYNEGVEGYPIRVEPPPEELIQEQEFQRDRIAFFSALSTPGRLNEWFRDAAVPQFPPDIRRRLGALTVRGDRILMFGKPQGWHFDLTNGSIWTPTEQGLFTVGGDSFTDVAAPFKASEDITEAKAEFATNNYGAEYVSYPTLTLIWGHRGPFIHRRGVSPHMEKTGGSQEGKRYTYDIARVYAKAPTTLVHGDSQRY